MSKSVGKKISKKTEISLHNVLGTLKKNKPLVALGIFALVCILAVGLSVAVLKIAAVPVCFLIVIEAAIAVCLHKSELWLHGILILAQLITGIILAKLALIIFCIIVYIAAIVTLQMFSIGEKKHGKR